MNESLLQLQLENTHLRSKLDTLVNTDESKSELLSLLQQQSLDNEQLQQKVQMLNSGVVEIDKERKRLVKAAHTAQADLDMVRQQHDEVSKHLHVKEMEVRSLADRISGQEMQLEDTTNENSELKRVIDQLDTQLDQAKTLLEESEQELKEKEQFWHDGKIKMEQELFDREGKISQLSDNLSLSAKLNEEHSHMIRNLEQAISDMHAELNEAQLNHAQALGKMEKELDNERHAHVETLEKLTATRDNLHKENGDLVEELQRAKSDYLQLQDNHRASVEASDKLTIELELERKAHTETQDQSKVTKEQFERENHDLVEELQKSKSDYSFLYEDRLAIDDTRKSLTNELDNERQLHAATQENLSIIKEQLEKEAKNLAEELEKTKIELQTSQDEYFSVNEAQEQLQRNHSLLKEGNTQLQEEVLHLKQQIEMKSTESENQQSRDTEKIVSLEKELLDEKANANKFRSQLRELNLKVKESDNETSNKVRNLERELEEVRQKYEAVIVSHQDEILSIQKRHEDDLADFETRGADVISDLEDTIASLQDEIVGGKMKNEESASKMQLELSHAKMEQDRLMRIIAENETKGADQAEKIEALSLYGKQRKEEAKALQSELERLQNSFQDEVREKENIANELENSRSFHEQEISELRSNIEDVKGQLVSAKAALSDRTNLIKDMVNQTKLYQNDLEEERNRTVSLEETVRRYKKQLTAAQDSSHGLEEEIHEKDTQYCEAIRNERSQRKSVEAELESFKRSMEDALRRRNEIEKENFTLKDKVQRQEKYIGRLQDRDKQNRRQSHAPRPLYMAGVEKELHQTRSKVGRTILKGGSKIGIGTTQQYRSNFGSEENSKPNFSSSVVDDFEYSHKGN